MYSGVLERVYTERQNETEMPEFFLDLNLNQILKELQEKAKGYDVRALYYRFPKDYEAVCYRQAIYREIRGKKLEDSFLEFSKRMRETRRYLELSDEAVEKQQYQMYFYNAVSEFVEGVYQVRDDLAKAEPESEGLAGLLEYVNGFCELPRWQECRSTINELKGMLSKLRFQ